jgi:CubicO group peptidase (beta-lactamase class C family)
MILVIGFATRPLSTSRVRRLTPRVLPLILGIIASGLVSDAVLGQPVQSSASSADSVTEPSYGQLARTISTPRTQQLESAIDSLFAAGMASRRVPGAALVIVHDGQIVMQRGYGVADIESGRVVSPDSTVFGVASVGKVITTLSVLQQAEAGRLSLGEDVSATLPKLGLPPGVLLRHLLTHTAGFGDQTIGVSARRPEDLLPLAEFVERKRPPVFQPVGTATSYSNYGFALAGLMVQTVSNTRFDRYVTERIFEPLGMNSSSFDQPLPLGIAARVATAYANGSASSKVSRIYFQDAPASAMFTTVADMGSLLVGLTGGGPTSSPLSPAWVDTLFARHFGNHDELPGMALAFHERSSRGHRTLVQGGAWQDYSAELYLIPEAGLGMFAAFNAPEGGPIAEEVWPESVRVLLGDSDAFSVPRRAVASHDQADLSRFQGRYRLNRYSRHTVARLGALIGAVREIRVEWDGTDLHLDSSRLMPLGQGVMEREDTGTHIAFRERSGSASSHLFFASVPIVAYERIAPWEYAIVHQTLLVGFVLLLAGIYWRESKQPAVTVAAGARSVMRTAFGLMLAFLVAILGVMAFADPWEFQYGPPKAVAVLLGTSYLLPALALAVTGIAFRDWKTDARWRLTFNVIVAWSFLFFLAHWNLLGINV